MSDTPDEVDQGRGATTPATPASAWLEEFVPRRFLSGGHMQTIAGNFLPRPSNLPPAENLYVEVDAATASKVLCHCHWQPVEVRSRRLTVVLVHGLEGSSDSQYVIGNADRSWAAGCNVVRVNMRNCGGTDHLSPTLYHSGLSGDVGAVVDRVVGIGTSGALLATVAGGAVLLAGYLAAARRLRVSEVEELVGPVLARLGR